MKILYCSYSTIPSDTANSIAVMKQCDALNKIIILKVILIKGKKFSEENYQEKYGIEPMDIILLPSWMLKYNELGLKLFCAVYAIWYKPDMIYSRDLVLNKVFCKMKMLNIYEIHQLDQQDIEFDKVFKKTLLYIMNSKYLKYIICISDVLKSECMAYGISEQKLLTLHSGFDSCKCKLIHEETMKKQERLLALYTGSNQNGKGVNIILQMAKLAPQYDFLIIGVKEPIAYDGDNLKQISWIDHGAVFKYLKQADILLLPTTSQKYKFHSPLKLFEYMAAGKVIIASDNPDIREVISDKKNGLLAIEANAEDFIEKIKLVDEDEELRKKLEFYAVKSVAKYSWDERAKKIIECVGNK